ncbi:E3 ubiquitin-protein ligase AIP2-like [Aristolochia californica]|uniref:E3 ubiquitin-protein ligase AIP2-like n=1 Tax=Aristolochia californica TaxID=171875 RepID=UPI0035D9A726
MDPGPQTPPNTPYKDSRFLFEGHLIVGPEPRPPAWLVSNRTNNFGPDAASAMLEKLVNTKLEISGLQDLDSVIEASLQEIGVGPKKPPPASKEMVARLPIITITHEIWVKLGRETDCAVCRENLVIDDKMQELPCKLLFHPNCLKPWLDEHNSCPICRHEQQIDDHAYESWKKREREAEAERKGATNALQGGEYMLNTIGASTIVDAYATCVIQWVDVDATDATWGDMSTFWHTSLPSSLRTSTFSRRGVMLAGRVI